MANKLKISVALNAVADTRGFKAFNNEMRATQAALRRLRPTLKVVTSAIKAVGVAGAAMKSLGGAVITHAAQVDKLSRSLGIGTEAVQVLGDLAGQTGGKAEDMAAALKKLQKSVEQTASGNKQLQERFRSLGIDFEKFRLMKPEQQMERLAIAVRGAADQQQAHSDLMALVGEEVAGKLTGALDKLATQGYDSVAKSAREVGVVMDNFSVRQLAQAERDIERFTTKLKVAFADVVTAPKNLAYLLYGEPAKWEALEEATAKYGKTSRKASAAARAVSEEMLKQGKIPIAAQVAKQAQAYAEAAHLALAEWERLDKSVNTTQADIVEFRQRNQGLLAGGIEGTRQELAEIEALLAKINASHERARVHAGTVEQAGDEARAIKEAVVNAQIEADLEAHDAAIAALSAARVRREAQAYQALAAQAQSAFAQIEQFEFAALSPGQQLSEQITALHGQLESLAFQGILTDEQWGRAREVLNEKFKESSRLIAEEQGMAQFAALGESVRGLIGEFERLDGVIEGELSGVLKDFVETGTADMKKLGQSMLNEVIQSMLKALVLKPLLTGIGNMFGGAGGGGLFGALGKGLMGMAGGIGARASGGPVAGAKPYLVGERGPELFIPPVSGKIIDANKTADALAGDTATGGDRGPQNVYHIDARGADAGAVTRLEAALLALAGPGVVERRAAAAGNRARRG